LNKNRRTTGRLIIGSTKKIRFMNLKEFFGQDLLHLVVVVIIVRIIMTLFIMCIILTIQVNKEHNKFVIQKEVNRYLRNDLATWRRSCFEYEYEDMKDGLDIEYQENIINNLLTDDSLKRLGYEVDTSEYSDIREYILAD